MDTESNENKIEKNLQELNYPKKKDVFSKEDHISIDANGNLAEK